jgi:hypothetical protein
VHLFWVIGLLLALIDIPDFGGALSRMAGSLERLAGISPGRGADGVPVAGDPGEQQPEVAHGHIAPAHLSADGRS